MTPMPFADLERVYEALAAAIDRAGPDGESLMLAKLVLILAHRTGQTDVVLACIDACATTQPSSSTAPSVARPWRSP